MQDTGAILHFSRLPSPGVRSDLSVPGKRTPGAEWRDLMVAAQSGNAAAYRRLLNEVRPWLARYFARRLPPGCVEDAVQDTMIAMHKKRHTYDTDRPFGPWLASVARYKWIDRLRAMKRSASEELPDTLAVDGHESAVTSMIALNDLLTTIKPAQADVIRLVKLEGFSIAEASARTGQTASLVKVNIHRGLNRLMKRVQGYDDAE